MRKSILAQNTACNAIVQLVDQGATYPNGYLNIFTSDSTLLTSMPLSYPAYMDATDGTSVANMIYDSTVFTDGTAALYTIVNRDSTVIWDGSVSTSAGIGDVKLNSVVLFTDSTVSITNAFYYVPR